MESLMGDNDYIKAGGAKKLKQQQRRLVFSFFLFPFSPTFIMTFIMTFSEKHQTLCWSNFLASLCGYWIGRSCDLITRALTLIFCVRETQFDFLKIRDLFIFIFLRNEVCKFAVMCNSNHQLFFYLF